MQKLMKKLAELNHALNLKLAAVKKFISKLPLRVYLMYLLVASLVCTGVTFSSYVSTSQGGDSVRVALFANDVSISVPVTAQCYPGCSFEIPITVTNYKTEGLNKYVCEVTQDYTLEATLLVGSLPLEVTFKNGNNTGRLYANSSATEMKHTVVITWPTDNSETRNYDYADEIEVLRITAVCNQAD